MLDLIQVTHRRATHAARLLCCAVFVFACGDDEDLVESAPPVPSAAARPETDPASEVRPENPAEHDVDLLHSVRSRVTTSSVNNEDPRQTLRLTDGSLQTAWNSAPTDRGDTPERIIIQLPEQVVVSAIALTAGYTSARSRVDLFTANRRIQAVRIHHGDDQFDARLDIDDRSLQHVEVHGNGGEWIIELIDWVDGTRPWREMVVSEVQVLGLPGENAPPYEPPSEPTSAPEHLLTSEQAIWRALVAASASFETLRSLMDLSSTGFLFSLNYEHGIASNVACTDAHFAEDLILPADFDQEEHWSPVLPANIPRGTLSCLPDLSMCMTEGQPGGKEYAFEFRVNPGGRRFLASVVIPSRGYTLGEFSFLPTSPSCAP